MCIRCQHSVRRVIEESLTPWCCVERKCEVSELNGCYGNKLIEDHVGRNFKDRSETRKAESLSTRDNIYEWESRFEGSEAFRP